MIVFDQLSFKYGDTTHCGLLDISLKINKGSCAVLVGNSGSGKTTLLRVVNGLAPTFYKGDLTGAVWIEGEKVTYKGDVPVVGTVFQDPRAQFFTSDTTSELVFTCENYGLPRTEIAGRLEEILEKINGKHLLNRSLFALSSGEKQKIAVASVWMIAPKVIIMDEPSSNLDPPSIERLRQVIVHLKAQGFTLLLSEHRLHYLKEVVDTVVHLEQGRVIDVFSGEQFFSKPRDAFRRFEEVSSSACSLGETVLKPPSKVAKIVVNQMHFKHKKSQQAIFKGLDAAFYGGEITAIVGANGAGKTTFCKILCGLLKETKGTVCFDGQVLSPSKRQKQVAFVMQDADFQLFAPSVYEELLLAAKGLDHPEQLIEDALERVKLSHKRDVHPMTLSGGEKQRLTIACAFVKPVSVVVFDEPTSGLDFVNMLKIRAVLEALKAQGKAVIVITHDYEFIENACDRTYHINRKEELDYDESL